MSDSVQCCGAHQTPLSMGFSKQEYWSGLPCPPPGESSLPRDQTSLKSLALAGSLPLVPPDSKSTAHFYYCICSPSLRNVDLSEATACLQKNIPAHVIITSNANSVTVDGFQEVKTWSSGPRPLDSNSSFSIS